MKRKKRIKSEMERETRNKRGAEREKGKERKKIGRKKING